jgi:DNA-binding NarL/FixJ family response regulator
VTRRDLHLDPDDLARLRDAVRRAQEPQPSVDHERVLAVHDAAPADAALTVDFTAAQELGMPLLVVRMPIAPRPAAMLDVLTPREFEVAGYVAGGLANKEIAARLGIRESTVKEHVHRILAKTELPSRTAVARAYAGGEDPSDTGRGRAGGGPKASHRSEG